ncbi:MAG TPA: acyltransferase, partial [Roseiflexaceae bacterium]
MLTSPTDQPRDDQTERAASGAAPAPGVRLPYLPGLDGLRAIAVLAVLLYHADLPWMPGGFLGVEVFFVVSGYLITGLLLAEREQTGRVNLGAFWLRRARRLLPALFALLAATLAFAVLFLPDEVAGLRGDVLAALGYVTNWGLIFSQRSYFETVGRPPLLQHLWSLAVEEQFYLLWPLLLLLGLRRLDRRRMLLTIGAV